MLHVFLLLLQLAGGVKPTADRALAGDPVDLSTGLYENDSTDLPLSDIVSVALVRSYRTEDPGQRAFGIGASHMYEMFLVGDRERFTWIDLILSNGHHVHFERTTPGTSWEDAEFIHTNSPVYYAAKLSWNRQWGGWDLTFSDGKLYEFSNSYHAVRGAQAAVIGIRDAAGNRLDLKRNEAGELLAIASPRGRRIDFTYDSSHRIIRAEDSLRRRVQYEYDDRGRLAQVIAADGRRTRYTYDDNHRMLTVEEGGTATLTNQYDAKGRVIRQTRRDGTYFAFEYQTDAGGRIVQADTRLPAGGANRVLFNREGFRIEERQNLGTPQEEITIFEREPLTNRLLRTERTRAKPPA